MNAWTFYLYILPAIIAIGAGGAAIYMFRRNRHHRTPAE